VVLESGAGWIGYWLDRLDAVYEATFIGERVPLAEKPSHYFKTRCFISADPDERTIPALTELLGADRFFWASDYPHADHTASYMREVEELAGLLDEASRKRFWVDAALRDRLSLQLRSPDRTDAAVADRELRASRFTSNVTDRRSRTARTLAWSRRDVRPAPRRWHRCRGARAFRARRPPRACR
jgi:hypothetical protein